MQYAPGGFTPKQYPYARIRCKSGVYLVHYAPGSFAFIQYLYVYSLLLCHVHQVYIWCIMRQPGGFTRPPRTHFRSAGLNFTQLRHLSFNSLVLHFNFTTGVDPFHYSGRVGPQEVALSACLGLACLSHEVFSLLVSYLVSLKIQMLKCV